LYSSGALKIYVAAAAAESLKEKAKDRMMKLSLPPILVENLVWVPVISLCKIFIPCYMLDALLCQNWPFLSTHHETLWLTLIIFEDSSSKV